MKEKEFLNKLRQRIRDLRTKKSWTLCDLTVIINMDISDISKLELGYTNSKILTLYKISQAFGITVSELTNIE